MPDEPPSTLRKLNLYGSAACATAALFSNVVGGDPNVALATATIAVGGLVSDVASDLPSSDDED